MRRIQIAVAVLGLALGACAPADSEEGTDETRAVAPPPTTVEAPPPGTSLVARATGPNLTALDAPDSDVVVATLSNPIPVGAPLVLLVAEQREGWLHVRLPVRPNGTTGWVRESEVDLVQVPYKVVVNLAAYQLQLFENDELVLETAVGLGRDGEPTPPGTYFVTELLQPPDPNGPYGPYAYGLSGFSDVHFEFGGGPGQIGLHGTNDPSSIGRPASAGCIRLPNDAINRLVEILPLGTPVEIVA